MIGVLTGVLTAALAGLPYTAGAASGRPAGSTLVYFRPVLCYAPPYHASTRAPEPLPTPPCSSSTRLDQTNLGASPNRTDPAGFTANYVPPDLALGAVPSTPVADVPSDAPVLVPGLPGTSDDGGDRLVLGPVQMTSRAVARAQASRNQTGAWVVDYATTRAASALWDKVAKENFHRILGIEFDGVVVSAPIIQPAQATFTSFNGLGEISGNLTRTEAQRLARAMEPSRG